MARRLVRLLVVLQPERLVLCRVAAVLALGPLGVAEPAPGLDERVARGVVELERERRHLARRRQRDRVVVGVDELGELDVGDEDAQLDDELGDLVVQVRVLDLAQRLVVQEVADRVGEDALDGRELAASLRDRELVLGDRDGAVLRLDELAVEVVARGALDRVDGAERLDLTRRLDLVVLIACCALPGQLSSSERGESSRGGEGRGERARRRRRKGDAPQCSQRNETTMTSRK